MGKLWKWIVDYFKKEFTVEKLLDRYSDKLFEILMDKAEEAINNNQKGKLIAADIKVSHDHATDLGKSLHVFTIEIVVDKQQLIEILKRR